jgi:hypothetical protein
MKGRSFRTSLLLATFALAACRGAPGVCKTTADCGAFDGKRVTVVGIYRALSHPKGEVRGEKEPVMARVDIGSGDGPYLEPFYKSAARRSDVELARFDGKRVRVTGVYYREQPRNPDDPPHAEAFGGPCIADIEELSLAP